MADNNRSKPKACRNLMLEFEEADRNREGSAGNRTGDEQRAHLENEINDVLATNLNSKIQKWNFDFVNETPLEGDWDWYFDSEGDNSQNSRNARSRQRDNDAKDDCMHIR